MYLNVLFVIGLLVSSATTWAQIPTIKAKGGEGVNVDWGEVKATQSGLVDGPGFFDNPCAQGVSPEHVSSSLKSQGSHNYKMQNLSDDDPQTAWVEGVLGYGIGEWFEVQAITVNVIYNGYQSSPSKWENNSRVKRFKVYHDGEPLCFLDLTDEMGAQYFELPHRANWESKGNFRFEIVEVYKGKKWEDVCISHIDHVACCMAPTTLITMNEGNTTTIKNLAEGNAILAIDLDNQKTFESTVAVTTKQRHLSLLEVQTATYKIAITPDHPLYIEGKGFVSLGQLLSQMQADETWNDLVAKGIKVMVFNPETEATYYEVIEQIEHIKGDFQTHTILSMEKGSTYIANGFVNKVY